MTHIIRMFSVILEACFLLQSGWIKFTKDLGLGFSHGMLLEVRYILCGGFLSNFFFLLMKQSKNLNTCVVIYRDLAFYIQIVSLES